MSIYADWGSTRLRLWRVREGKPFELRNGPGILSVQRPPVEILRDAIAGWHLGEAERIVVCGMAGARGGLHEVPYRECPAGLAVWRKEAVEMPFGPTTVRIAAGLACRTAGRPDVMRGEETQVFGALRLRPELAAGRQLMVHPGTHSKWIEFEDGMVRHFQTFPSGEMFALLQRSSMAGVERTEDEGEERQGFDAGVDRAEKLQGLLGSVFEARSGQVHDGRSGSWARGFLSGLVLGCEAVERRRAGGLAERIVVMGDPALTERYARVLGRFGITSDLLEGDACVLAGLELLNDDD